ncbi:MAG: copper-translocating P-type ATPase, partial [Anaerolineales bacterium]
METHETKSKASHEHQGHPTGQHAGMEHSAHDEHSNHATMDHSGGDHKAHVDHTGHEQMFRQKFWVSLVLSIPVIVFSPAIQGFLGFSMPAFPGSQWITPVFSVIVFFYGGLPFLQMAVPELRNRAPGMMTLISLAIIVAFVYSLFALLVSAGSTFFWELVTLIDIMLLGHWLEMRSVRQASGALNELARLMPDTAERIRDNGETEQVPADQLRNEDLVLVRPGSSVPADGVVE